jgi:hypothetical protein
VSVGVLDSCARPFSTTNRSPSKSDERRPPILAADNLPSDAEYPATTLIPQRRQRLVYSMPRTNIQAGPNTPPLVGWKLDGENRNYV